MQLSGEPLEHTRRASDEGWRMLLAVAIILPALGLGTLIFEMGSIFRTIWTLILFIVSGLTVTYAGANLRSEKSFSCRLNPEEFSQSVPVPSCGESFQIKLTDITRIEIHDSGGEGPSEEWYLHTRDGRYRITSGYGNPHRKFGQAIQRALPHIETIET